jgi:hypothetical protein
MMHGQVAAIAKAVVANGPGERCEALDADFSGVCIVSLISL